MDITYDRSISPGDVISCGDIHGRFDLLEEFLNYVKGTETTVILLGDLIDRGNDDIGVLNRVKQLLDDPDSHGLANFYCLMGNHEVMFADAMNKGFAEFLLWQNNGGNFEQMPEMVEHLEWIEKLPLYMTIGDTLFIHAGIHPGQDPIKLANSKRWENLTWIREPFLTCGPEFEKWAPHLKRVVHGHTPYLDDARIGTVNVSDTGDRIGIDTAACYSGILTSYNVTKNTFQKFTVEGKGV